MEAQPKSVRRPCRGVVTRSAALARMGFVGSLVCALVITFSWTNPPELYAQPEMPHQFVGTVTINGTTAPDGAVVAATIDGIKSVTAIVVGGNYMLKIRNAHGLPSPTGKTIKFTVDGQSAKESQLFQAGGGTELNLTVTPAPIAQPIIITPPPIAQPIIITPAPLPAPTIAAPSPAQPVAPPAPVQPVAPPTPIIIIVTATPPEPVVIVATPPGQPPVLGGVSPGIGQQPSQPPVLGGISPGIGQPGQPPVLGGVSPGIGQPGQPSVPVVNAPIPTPAVQATPVVGPAGPAGPPGPPGPPGESSSSNKTWLIVALVASGLAIFLSLDHIVAVFFRRGGPTAG
jgi:hypothetical protein